jgi:(p)ppGpp synthase/HD superfamily hydrolase
MSKLNKMAKDNLLLAKMIRIVAVVYKDKLNYKNKAAILHPIKVMMKLSREDTETRMIAIAQDLITMSKGTVTLDSLEKEGFSGRVLEALSLLNHDPSDSYRDYILKLATNPDAALVKKFSLKYRGPNKECDISKLEEYSKSDAYDFLNEEKDSDKEKSLLLAKMIAIAAEAHEEQLDKGDHAYILHPFRLLLDLSNEDTEVQIMAVGHDVIEDSDGKITIETLQKEGFCHRTIAGLHCLTHWDYLSYAEYILIIYANDDAVLVKMADIRDNSNMTRLKGVRTKDQTRIVKYSFSYLFLGHKMTKDVYLEKVASVI